MGEEFDELPEAAEGSSREGYGFFNRVSDPQLFVRVRRKVNAKGYFTDRVALERVTVRLSDIVLVISPDGHLEYVSHARPIRSGTTGTRGFRANGPLKVEIRPAELEASLQAEFREEATRGFSDPSFRPSRAAWHAIWNAIKNLRPALAERFHRIEQLRFDEAFEFDESSNDEQIFYEKDAVGVALDVAGISFGGVFAEVSEGRRQDKDLVESLCGTPTEDVVIHHDVHTFPNYVLQSDQLHACEFVQHGRKLKIFNVNRRPAEKALGVDLIYHNLTYDAFTFIQYKMLEREGSAQSPAWRYRPNDQFDREISRMRSARNDLRGRTATTSNLFRFGDDPFYFKLCRRQHLKVNSGQLVSGAYLNLTHCDLILNEIQQGAARLFEPGRNVPRWLNRTQFTDLVAKGWIGTNNVAPDALATYVNAALEAHNSVLIAVAEARQPDSDDDDSTESNDFDG